MAYSILVVEDDPITQKYLSDLLTDNYYLVQTVNNGIKALEIIAKSQPDLMILDLGLPQLSGESVITEVRKMYPGLRIIVLSAKDNIKDIITGLDLGADDYMTKPFNTEELLARVKARLKKAGNDTEKLEVEDLELNPLTASVTRGGKEIRLTPQEFKLLEHLMKHSGQVLSRDMILSRLWSASSDVETRIVDTYIGYLRKKVDRPFVKRLIQSVRGFGYMIKGD